MEEGEIAAVDPGPVARHLVRAARLLHAARQVVVADVQARLLDLLPESLHRVEILLARDVLVAELLPVGAHRAAKGRVDADRALDAERHVELGVDAEALASGVELADHAQPAGVPRARSLHRAPA